jgi:hypothetical protein
MRGFMIRGGAAFLALALTATNGAAQNPSQSLLDGCTLEALDRVPKVGGVRVTNTSVEYRNSVPLVVTGTELEFWIVTVLVEFNGRPVSYGFLCRIFDNREATLLRGSPGTTSSASAAPPQDAIPIGPPKRGPNDVQMAPGVTMSRQPPGPPVYRQAR